VGVTAGDNTTVQAIANAFNAGVAIGATGLLSGGTRTIADYGAAILSLNATQGQNVKSTLEWRDSLFQTLKSKAASISAVNLDEEMANMVLLQNAYAANARVISTTSELFDVLINIRR
jgi:flagellar hook-associated protein 1 FlgK